MPAGTMGLRTIWISLRAVNYTMQTFKEVIRSTTMLTQTENELARATITTGTHALAAGLMWTVLGQSMDDSISKSISSIGVISQLISVIKPYVAALLTIGGVIWMLVGVEQLYVGLKGSKIAAILIEKLALDELSISWLGVALAMGAAVGIFLALRGVLGTFPAMLIAVAVAVGILAIQLWLAAGAMSVLTWGLAAIAGGLAISGAIAAVAGVREFPMGTRMIEQTGMAVVHKNEVIYNPATNRPLQVGNDLGQGGHSTTIFEMPVHIDELNTKASVDDVDEKLRQSLHKVARNVRG